MKLPTRKVSWRQALLAFPSSERAELFCDRAPLRRQTGASRCSLGIEDGGAGNLSSRVRLSPKDVSAGSSHPSQKVVPHPSVRSTPYPRPRESHEKIRTESSGSSESTSEVDSDDPEDSVRIIAVLALPLLTLSRPPDVPIMIFLCRLRRRRRVVRPRGKLYELTKLYD